MAALGIVAILLGLFSVGTFLIGMGYLLLRYFWHVLFIVAFLAGAKITYAVFQAVIS